MSAPCQIESSSIHGMLSGAGWPNDSPRYPYSSPAKCLTKPSRFVPLGAILELLTLQTSDALVTTAGKTALKKAIAERVSTAIEDVKVFDVLFADFVVQL